MNNRIGTYLRRETEVPNLRDPTDRFHKGELVAEVIQDDTYVWALVTKVETNGTCDILTREPESQAFLTRQVRPEVLKKYAISEKVEQNSTLDVNLTEDTLLETYSIP